MIEMRGVGEMVLSPFLARVRISPVRDEMDNVLHCSPISDVEGDVVTIRTRQVLTPD